MAADVLARFTLTLLLNYPLKAQLARCAPVRMP